MTNEEQNIYRSILLKTMKAFIRFCKDNEIQYVAAYGTILGAVRHNGLIPWDDDIDVFMTRANYEKFLSLKRNQQLVDYEIVDLENSGYYLPYAKFCDKHTTLWEVKNKPFIVGVFIDVFPLDMATDGIESRRYHNLLKQEFESYSRSITHYDINDYWSAISKFHLKEVLWMFRNTLKYTSNKSSYYKNIGRIVKCIRNMEGPYYMYYRSLAKFEDSLFDKEYIDDTFEHVFEDFTISIPKKYDALLTKMYGDYMKEPPKEQQVSQHFHYYFNSKERLDIEQVKEKIRNAR